MADEVWARDIVEQELTKALNGGEGAVEFEALQQRTGVGTGDLRSTIGVMMSEGAVVEAEADTFEFVPPEDREAPQGHDPDDPDYAEGGGERRAGAGWRRDVAPPDELDDPPPGMPPVAGTVELVGGPLIRLTRGMVAAMSDDALGSVIKAAVSEHEQSDASDELTIAIA